MSPSSLETAGTGLTARIVQRLLASVEAGEFTVGQRLPSEREFAEQVSVSRNTVTAAYSQLEQLGIICRIQGRGAYLCAVPSSEENFSWSGKVSRTANSLDEPVLELLARRCAGDIRYPFSAGTPSLEVFPKEVYQASLNGVVDQDLYTAMAVAPTEGQWALRTALGVWLGERPQQILVTAGAQEGIDLVARCLIEPGDSVVIDSPTYPGALQSFLSAGARPLPWSTDWSLKHLEELLIRYSPKLIFTMPTLQNPTGQVMPLEKRKGLLDLATRYKVPIVEDDVYARMFFGAEPGPESLYSLDRQSQVINISTFSKMFAPGVRVGWLRAPLFMVKQLALIKMRSNLFTSGLNQLVLADLLGNGEFDRHLLKLRAQHAELFEIAWAALQPCVSKGWLCVTAPQGSLYLWCKVLVPIDMDLFLSKLEARGVSVAPGVAFDPRRKASASSQFRLCFSAVSRSRLDAGIALLNDVLEESIQVTATELGSENS